MQVQFTGRKGVKCLFYEQKTERKVVRSVVSLFYNLVKQSSGSSKTPHGGDMLHSLSQQSPSPTDTDDPLLHRRSQTVDPTSFCCFIMCIVGKKREAHYSRGDMHLLVNTLRICSLYYLLDTSLHYSKYGTEYIW